MSKPNAPKEGDGYHSGRKLPKPEKVQEVSKDANEGAAVKSARKQNTSDGKPYPQGRNVIENKSDSSILSHPKGGE